MVQPLFRPEARPESKVFGGAVVTQPLSFLFLTLLLALVLGVAVAFLAWGSYARKETVSGFLVPSHGVVKVYPTIAGVFEAAGAEEGQSVREGQLLFRIHQPRTVDGRDADQEARRLIGQQLAELGEALEQERRRFALEEQSLRSQLSELGAEVEAILRQRRVLAQRLELLDRDLQRTESLFAEQLVSARELDRERAQRLALLQQDADLESRHATQRALIHQTEYRLAQLPAHGDEALRRLRAEVASLQQRGLDLEMSSGYEARAPVAGTVTAVSAVIGSEADPRVPVLSILPEGSHLEAHLFVPTRAVGFVEVGQPVRILYDAFPYQQFGTYTGEIREITQTVLLEGEVPLRAPASEPVYKVKVSLDHESVVAYGKRYPLQSGMLLQADILLADRSLIEWLLEPLYSLRGRMGA